MSQRGVIFDMDGVLVDSYGAHFASWRRAAAKYGLSLSEADFARTFGQTSREIIRELWPGRVGDQQVDEFDREKERIYREILESDFPEMRGAGELIAALHAAGFALAIGSSGPPENVALGKRRITNGQFISASVDGSEVRKGKPDPQVFVAAAEKLGLDSRCCAVVEDAPVGIEAARRAGMVAIAITGTSSRDALAARADLVVDSLTELSPTLIAELIDRNWERGS